MAGWFADARKLTARDWFSVALLAATIAALVVELVWVWTAATHPAGSGCHNAPLKVIRDPQLVGIGICLAGLVVGRLSTRTVFTSRQELNDRIVPPGEQSRHARYALLTQIGLTGALLFITFLDTYESVTLKVGVWPITYFMRCAAEAATWQTYVAAFFFCLLVGRWLWLPATPR